MIMSFDLETDVVSIVKLHDAGIVGKYADAPIIRTQATPYFRGGCKNGCLEQIVDSPTVHVDKTFERFVRAMLGPGLSDGLQFDIGRISSQFAEVRLDGLHLRQAQGQLAVDTQLRQGLVIEVANRNNNLAKRFVGAIVKQLG